MVFLKLQPYRKFSIVARKNVKLSTRFYGPFKILEKIGKVADHLKLPVTSRLHLIFHILGIGR